MARLGRFVARRVLLLVPVLFGILVTSFSLSRVIPADAARLAEGQYATEDIVQAPRRELGLHRLLPEESVRFIVSIAHADFGRSLVTSSPVAQDSTRFYAATLELGLAAVGVVLMTGHGAGVLCCWFESRWPDFFGRFFAVGVVVSQAYIQALCFTHPSPAVQPKGATGAMDDGEVSPL